MAGAGSFTAVFAGSVSIPTHSLVKAFKRQEMGFSALVTCMLVNLSVDVVETVRQLYMDGPCRILLALSTLSLGDSLLDLLCSYPTH